MSAPTLQMDRFKKILQENQERIDMQPGDVTIDEYNDERFDLLIAQLYRQMTESRGTAFRVTLETELDVHEARDALVHLFNEEDRSYSLLTEPRWKLVDELTHSELEIVLDPVALAQTLTKENVQ